MLFLVDVGDDRHADLFLDALQNLQTFIQPKCRFCVQRRAVGLIKRALKDILRPCSRTGLFQSACNHLRVICAFQLAGAREQSQRLVIGNRQIADGNMFHYEDTCSRRIEPVREIIR